MKKLLLLFILIPFLAFTQTQIGQDIIGENPLDSAGTRVDISSDGSVIAIGAPGNDDNGQNSGHVRIYKNINGNWVQIGQDIEGANSSDEEGIALSLCSDGSIVALGSERYFDGINYGYVRVFENINNTWTLLGADIYGSTGNPSRPFGNRVKLSSDGNTIVVAYGFGPVKVLRYINGIWTQLGQEINGGYSNYVFGSHITISSDGNRIVIGDRDTPNGAKGKLQIYEYDGLDWIQIGQDIIGDNLNDNFGAAVSLSSNGEIVAAAAYRANVNGSDSGQVKIFKLINNTWTQLGQNLNGDAQNDNYGMGVDLSDNGEIIAIGSPNNSNNNSFTGHVKVFQLDNNNWVQRGIDIEGNVSDQLGNSLALSSDGRTLVAGAFTAELDGSGLTRVFDLSSILSVEDEKQISFSLFPNPTKTQFTIQLNTNTELKNVNIYNNLGQLFLTSKERVINTIILSAGLYVVELETNKGKGSKKLIIE